MNSRSDPSVSESQNGNVAHHSIMDGCSERESGSASRRRPIRFLLFAPARNLVEGPAVSVTVPVPKSVELRLLFGSQDGDHVALGLDSDDSEVRLARFRFLHLRLDGRHVGLGIPHHRPKLSFADLPFGRGTDGRAVRVERQGAEFADLLIVKADFLLMAQEMP